LAKADKVVDNSGTLNALHIAADALHEQLLALSANKKSAGENR
jgi:hypothetical protein